MRGGGFEGGARGIMTGGNSKGDLTQRARRTAGGHGEETAGLVRLMTAGKSGRWEWLQPKGAPRRPIQ